MKRRAHTAKQLQHYVWCRQFPAAPERLTLPDKQIDADDSSRANAVSLFDSVTPVAADNAVFANRLTVCVCVCVCVYVWRGSSDGGSPPVSSPRQNQRGLLVWRENKPDWNLQGCRQRNYDSGVHGSGLAPWQWGALWELCSLVQRY